MASFKTIWPFYFCTVSIIVICCSPIKRFPNDHKRHCSHLQVSILHRMAPVKVYLIIYVNLKSNYLKKGFCAIYKKQISQPQFKGCLMWKQMALGLILESQLYWFCNSLSVTQIRHSLGNCWRLTSHLLKHNYTEIY